MRGTLPIPAQVSGFDQFHTTVVAMPGDPSSVLANNIRLYLVHADRGESSPLRSASTMSFDQQDRRRVEYTGSYGGREFIAIEAWDLFSHSSCEAAGIDHAEKSFFDSIEDSLLEVVSHNYLPAKTFHILGPCGLGPVVILCK